MTPHSTYAREVDQAIQTNKNAQERQLAVKRSSSTRSVAGLDPLRDTSIQMALQRTASATSSNGSRRKRKRPGPKSKTEVQVLPRASAEPEPEEETTATSAKTAKQIKKETRRSFAVGDYCNRFCGGLLKYIQPRTLAGDHWYTIPQDQIDALNSIRASISCAEPVTTYSRVLQHTAHHRR